MHIDRSSPRLNAGRRAGAAALSLLALTALASCAVHRAEKAASEAPTTAAGAPEPEAQIAKSPTAADIGPTTVDGAIADLQRAEGELDSAFAALGQPGRSSAVPGATTAPTTPAQKPPAAPSKAAESDLSSGNPCATACRALASMERATDHLCSLAGDADARCEGARSRLRGARDRVRETCGCAGWE